MSRLDSEIPDNYKPANLYFGNGDCKLLPIRSSNDLNYLSGNSSTCPISEDDVLNSYTPSGYKHKFTRIEDYFFPYVMEGKKIPFRLEDNMKPLSINPNRPLRNFEKLENSRLASRITLDNPNIDNYSKIAYYSAKHFTVWSVISGAMAFLYWSKLALPTPLVRSLTAGAVFRFGIAGSIFGGVSSGLALYQKEDNLKARVAGGLFAGLAAGAIVRRPYLMLGHGLVFSCLAGIIYWWQDPVSGRSSSSVYDAFFAKWLDPVLPIHSFKQDKE